MRLKKLERDEAFAWQVLREAPYATLAVIRPDGTPYCMPVNAVADEAYKVVYFHCAGAGERWESLQHNPQVCLSAVSGMSIIPDALDTAYRSAVVHGRAQIVTEEAEKVKALLLLVETLDPRATVKLNEHLERRLTATQVVKIVPELITGKENKSPETDPFASRHA